MGDEYFKRLNTQIEEYDEFLNNPNNSVILLQAIYEAKLKVIEEVEEILLFEIKH